MAVDSVSTRGPDNQIEIIGEPLANILWRWVGVRAVPHLPCRFNCALTVALGERLLEFGTRAGFESEMDHIRQILSWPLEWSALHGIAEVKTPVLKVSTRTDATARKYIVRWCGTSYPDEGARGLGFPYRTPKRVPLTRSPRYQRGLDHTIEPQAIRPDWYHLDNGFSSRAAMDAQHRPLVALARRHLAGVRGHVLDLGCGNGALLQKICRDAEGLIPCGVDIQEGPLEHARALHPDFAAGFILRDFFDLTLWLDARRYAMVILMVGRLHEVSRNRAEALLTSITTRCDRLMVYAYRGWSREGLESLASRAGLQLQDSAEGSAGIVASLRHDREGTPTPPGTGAHPVADG
jgi:hypothetical protein